MQTSDRRPFAVVLALIVAGAVAAAACGSSPTSPVSLAGPTGGIAGTVSGNHAMPHLVSISAAQLSAGLAVTLDMSNGLHSHAVALTAEQVKQIAAAVRVSVTSSTDPHSNGSDPHNHGVTFN